MNKVIHAPLTNVLLFSLFWALEIFTAKLAFLDGAKVMPFSLQSFVIALLFIAIVTLPKKLHKLFSIPFSVLKWVLLASAILLGIGGFLGNVGIQMTTAINAGFLTQVTTVTTALFAWMILKEKVTKTKIVLIGVILLGTFLLVTNGTGLVPHIGDIFIILACFAWGFGPVLIKKMINHESVDPDIASLLRPAAGIPVLLIFVALAPLYPPELQKVFNVNIFEVSQGHYVILNGIFIALTWLFVNRTLKVASASYTALLGSITPILVAILAVTFLRETITSIQFIGILLILTASYLIEHMQFHKH
ncbi:MAG TPA: DMT family transporter [Patescibacteria group bacterium]|nr:DMT family transporter [Patescibacteria group bacterium]